MTTVVDATISQSTTGSPATTTESLDYPFYNGSPKDISGRGWATIVGATLAGGAVDMFLPVGGPTWLAMLVRGGLFVAIPMTAYILVARPAWRVLFRGVGRREVKLWFGFAALNVLVTSIVAGVLSQVLDMHANPMNDMLAGLSGGERVATFAAMVPQLFGEELFTILLLLAALTWLSRVVRLPRRAALVTASLIAMLVFAAIHLPTYGGNIVQCVAIIGIARLVLLVPFLKTKNIWASTGAHVLNDWTLFAIALVGTAAAA